MSERASNWPVPKFNYGDTVAFKPLEDVTARVVDIHVFGMLKVVEYDIRYFLDGKEFKVRAFEDELDFKN